MMQKRVAGDVQQATTNAAVKVHMILQEKDQVEKTPTSGLMGIETPFETYKSSIRLALFCHLPNFLFNKKCYLQVCMQQ